MPKIKVPFIVTDSNRSYLNTKDALSQNIFIEQGDTNYIVKRPGVYILKSYTALTAGDAVTYPAGIARGWIYSKSHDKYYIVIGAKLWAVNTSLTTFTAVTMATVPSSATSPVYFTETQYGSTTSVVLHQPGATGQLWNIANGTPSVATLVTSSWTSASTKGAPVSLDTTLYTLTTTNNATTIQGSALSDPTTFTALNSINAYMYPDAGVTLARFRNQLVCFKDTSTEFFYDAANPTGSPLSRVNEAALPIGCASASSVVYVDENLVWLSRDQNGGLGVHAMSGAGVLKISNIFMDRIFASIEAVVNTGTVQASYLSFEGHKFYIISIEGTSPSNSALPGIAIPGSAIPGVEIGSAAINLFSRTFVYDFATQHWFEWSSTTDAGTQESLFFSFCLSGSFVSNTASYSNALVLDKDNGNIYEISPPPVGSISPLMYKDINSIQVKVVTNRIDGGTRSRKKVSLLEVEGDTTISSTLSIRYTDDDYQTWSTARTVDLSARPFLTNQGMFRHRAYEFTHTANTPLRLANFEINVDLMDH